ncbi:HCNGP-like protein-domain-containing protein [Gymnopilus junonius]|uniref:HCNGP-like protein-domain-containing protein n=1 Tax=Gymnopilus junonius TaxID=109634 RepID=A0A9P5TP24_GYMJU|nr:HCNGP-like protein-domain-containing protein [Gymnopilus junonius]
MMNGLVAYDYDSPSDTEAGPSTANVGSSSHYQTNDKPSRGAIKSSSEGRRIPKAQVIIKKPAISHKNARAHISDDLQNEPTPIGPSRTEPASEPPSSLNHPSSSGSASDELSRIRDLLRPPPISEVEDWGIPPETKVKCEPALQTQFNRFGALKVDPMKPIHYNDNLMGNRTFRNPHLYTQLVDWVDVDERSTNFPKDIWDPEDVRPEWFADQIGMSVFLPMQILIHAYLFYPLRFFAFIPWSIPHLSFLRFALHWGPVLVTCAVSPLPLRPALLAPPRSRQTLLRPAACNSWVRQFKADAQKERSEKQAAAQAAGKRTHIDFSTSSSKDKTAQPRKSRFQPYGAQGSSSGTYRQKTRWG